MLFRQLFDRNSCTYTYLIADPKTAEALLIDPVLEQHERDLALLKRLDLRLTLAMDTHIHADHVSGLASLREETSCKIGVPTNNETRNADFMIEEGSSLQCGNLSIKAIGTPGHTAAHIAYLVNHTHLLTGDALFIGGCGRTDFQGGSAGELYDCVTQKLFSLPDETQVYPGHDYNGLTVSTIGEEKRCNPRLTQSREAFITLMAKLDLPPPKQLAIAVPRNYQCGDVIA